MKNYKAILFMTATMACGASPAIAQSDLIVETDAYSWKGDTIFQNEFKAWAVSPYEIQSTFRVPSLNIISIL